MTHGTGNGLTQLESQLNGSPAWTQRFTMRLVVMRAETRCAQICCCDCWGKAVVSQDILCPAGMSEDPIIRNRQSSEQRVTTMQISVCISGDILGCARRTAGMTEDPIRRSRSSSERRATSMQGSVCIREHIRVCARCPTAMIEDPISRRH